MSFLFFNFFNFFLINNTVDKDVMFTLSCLAASNVVFGVCFVVVVVVFILKLLS